LTILDKKIRIVLYVEDWFFFIMPHNGW
jgi:hypothetical protein